MKKLFLLFSILFIFSCQPVEQLESIVFDNQQLSKFDVSSKTIEIEEIFEKKFLDPYIGHTLEVDPSQRIISWVNDNFKSIGNENIFIVSILDASLLQTEFENTQATARPSCQAPEQSWCGSTNDNVSQNQKH